MRTRAETRGTAEGAPKGAHGAARVLGWTAGLLALTGIAFAAAGDLDPNFGYGGIEVTADLPYVTPALDSAAQADGRIVVGGMEMNVAWKLRRFNGDGSPDTTFGTGGVASLFGSADAPGFTDLALEGDDDIVAVGKAKAGTVTKATVARLSMDGVLDTAFGTAGILRLSVPGSTYDVATAVAVQADGKILVGGYADVKVKKTTNRKWFLARIQSGGAIDTGFGTNGYAFYDPSSTQDDISRKALVVLPDGSIVAGGYAGTATGQWTVARFSAAGAFQAAITRSTGQFAGLAVDGAGHVVATGNTWVSGSTTDSAVVARYLTTGTGLAPDTSFGTGGETVVGIAGYDHVRSSAGAVACASGNEVVFSSYAYTNANPTPRSVWTMRLTSSGSLDTTFGTGGRVGPVDLLTLNDASAGVLVDATGRVLVAGYARAASSSTSGTDCIWFLARYLGQ